MAVGICLAASAVKVAAYPICLRCCYAMSGTDLAAAIAALCDVRVCCPTQLTHAQVQTAICLRAPYTMSGTEIAYAATHVMCVSMVVQQLRRVGQDAQSVPQVDRCPGQKSNVARPVLVKRQTSNVKRRWSKVKSSMVKSKKLAEPSNLRPESFATRNPRP
eukprot:3940287-Rhodomonas_salina.1